MLKISHAFRAARQWQGGDIPIKPYLLLRHLPPSQANQCEDISMAKLEQSPVTGPQGGSRVVGWMGGRQAFLSLLCLRGLLTTKNYIFKYCCRAVLFLNKTAEG